jgi:hypothetical protein
MNRIESLVKDTISMADDCQTAISVISTLRNALEDIIHFTNDPRVLEIITTALKKAREEFAVREVIVVAEEVLRDGQ